MLGRSDKGKHQGQRRDAVRDGKPRQLYAGNLRLSASRLRKPLGIFGGEVHHEADRGAGLVREPQDAGAAHLQQPGKRFSSTHQQSSVGGFKMDAVVGNEPCERQRARARRMNEIECEPRLPGSGRSADQCRSRPDQNGRGMDGR